MKEVTIASYYFLLMQLSFPHEDNPNYVDDGFELGFPSYSFMGASVDEDFTFTGRSYFDL